MYVYTVAAYIAFLIQKHTQETEKKIGRIKSGKWTTQITWKTNGVKYKSSKLAPSKLLIISGNVIKVEVW